MEPDEMRKHRLPLDDATADRLAAGELHPSDAPPGFAAVAAALSAARGDHVAAEPDPELVTAMVRAIEQTPSNDRTTRSMRSYLSIKIGALAGAALLSTAGAAAAATGNLPGPAQDAVAGVVQHVGVDLPRNDDHPANHGDQVSTTAHETAPGSDHGASVSATARSNHGQDDPTTSTTVGVHQEDRATEHAATADDHRSATGDHGPSTSSGPGDTTSTTVGTSHGKGSDHSQDVNDDHASSTSTTPTTVDDHGGNRGSSGSGSSGSGDQSSGNGGSGHSGSGG